MIQRIRFQNTTIAREFLSVQKLAYATEARLLGVKELLPMRDSVVSLRAAQEEFFGERLGGKLVGGLSWNFRNEKLEICRLFVHPHYFRRGIGGRLVRFALLRAAGLFAVGVSTGEKNYAAVKLYKGFGFQDRGVKVVEDGLRLVEFEKGVEGLRFS